jgi:Protein of unknown function DUF262
MAFQTPITIGKALERILRHDYVLPAIQREFVWQTDQIARLFDSLMQSYPIGSFLFWKVDRAHCHDYVFYEFMRSYHQRNARHLTRLDLGAGRDITAILDGQQRLTALNIGLQGSHAEKLPRKWYDNVSAYPVRHLYLNLMNRAPENELGMAFDFRFLTKERATNLSAAYEHWFPVSRILTMEPGPGIFDYVQDAGLGTNKFSFRTLSQLHDVVHRDNIINFFEEESQDLDKVLNIFIRVNSGGTTLSYSDLLLSIATAQWKDVEAREVIHGLVDELNETGQGFNFSKDLVLKTGLVLIDTPSIAFRVTNFNAANMHALEATWSSIARALRLAVRLISDFGFSERTLTADSFVIPIAYYLHKRNVPENYLTGDAARTDRDLVRSWMVRSLLKPGIWGSGLDTLLLNLRSSIQEYGASGFPLAEIESNMARLGKSLRFDEDEIQDLLSISYDDKRTFPLLSMLYPGMDFRNEFHVDHVFPRSRFSKRNLTNAGIPEADLDSVALLANQLPNLQLLEGPINVAKRDKYPTLWMNEHFPHRQARDAYRERHNLWNLPEAIGDFPEFFRERQTRIGDHLRVVLGVQPA